MLVIHASAARIVSVIVLALAMCAPAQALTARQSRAIDSYLHGMVAAHRFSGNVLVAVNDKVVYERSFGFADIEFRVRNTSLTRFRVFSITKQFTACAILILVQRGLVKLGNPVRAYLPNLPVAWQAVTIRDLLQHTSGLPQLENDWTKGFLANPAIRTQLQNLAAVVRTFGNVPPLHAPGTYFDYNNFGYDLLACVIEAVSKRQYTEFVRENVFVPAGMRNSGFVGRAAQPSPDFDGPAVVTLLAHGYNGTAASRNLQTAMAYQYASAGAGDMYSTARESLSIRCCS